MTLGKFPCFLLFLIAWFAITTCETSFYDKDDTHINWITYEKGHFMDEKKKEEPEHIRLLKLKSQKFREQNEDILNYLQQLHDSEHIEQRNNSFSSDLGDKTQKKAETKTKYTMKHLRNNKTVDEKNTHKDNLIRLANDNERFIQISTDDNSNEIADVDPNTPHTKKNSDVNDRVEGNDITEFVNLLGEMNGDSAEENIDDMSEKEDTSLNSAGGYANDTEAQSMYIYTGDAEQTNLYEKYKVKDNTDKGNMRIQQIESLEYLGSGYDIIFGNPIGDPLLKVDPGYRDSVIKLTYPKFDDDFPDLYKSRSPSGAYVRDEISCSRSEKETELNSLSAYSNELSTDTSINVSFFGISLFSASYGYKEMSKTLQKKKSKTFMLKNYCFQYVAALSSYGQWTLTDQFKRALSLLPPHFNSLEHEGTTCTPAEMKQNPEHEACGPSVHAWMTFFKSFGTHVSTLLHLGGKITQIYNYSRHYTENSSSTSSSSSVAASWGSSGKVSTSSSSSSHQQSDNRSEEKETTVIGGSVIYDPNKPQEFVKWAKSVRKLPMPIKGEYEPLSKIMPLQLLDVYTDAIEFYIKLYGSASRGRTAVPLDMSKIDLRKLLRETTKLVGYDGRGLVSVMCPENKTIIAGFKFSFPYELKMIDNIEISPCNVDEKTCESTTNDLQIYNSVFAMCATDPVPFMEQVTVSEMADEVILECNTKNEIVLMGFGIISKRDNKSNVNISMKACKYGKNHCVIRNEKSENDSNVSFITGWIVCISKDYMNSAHTTLVKNSEYQKYDEKNFTKQLINQSCPHDTLFHAHFTISQSQFHTRYGSCFRYSRSCRDNDTWCIVENKVYAQGFSLTVY